MIVLHVEIRWLSFISSFVIITLYISCTLVVHWWVHHVSLGELTAARAQVGKSEMPLLLEGGITQTIPDHCTVV